jgi:hypothetical protein
MFWWLLFGVLLFAFFTSKSDARWLPVVVAGQVWVKARKLSKRYCPSKRDKKRAAGDYSHDSNDETSTSTTNTNTNEPSTTSGTTCISILLSLHFVVVEFEYGVVICYA